VYVTGTTTGNNEDYRTTAYNASDGARLWLASYDGPGFPSDPVPIPSDDNASSLVVSPDGAKLYVTGRSGGNYATVAYDASNGAQLWVARYAGPANDDTPSSLAVSPDGTKIYVTGQSHGTGPYEPEFDYDYATVAYNASNGAQLWVMRYNNLINAYSRDVASSIGVSPDGTKVFVTGSSSATTGSEYATVAYNVSDGTQLWLTRYNAGEAKSLGVSPDGTKVYVTGKSGGNYATVAYSASNGAQLWVTRTPGFNASSLVVSRDGARVYVTGEGSGGDFATVAYDASDGSQSWATHYAGPFAQPHGIVLSPDGTKVYITGGSYNGALTQVYDTSDGHGLGGNIYKNAITNSVAVSPDGTRLYVTGQNGQGNGITIAYNAVEFP
jgi:DNA-binding beta-propeller fold protein YncE